MGPIGWPELIVILVVVVFIFGAGRITELAKAAGQGVREFKAATRAEASPAVDRDAAIREAAVKLGITVEGKTTSQLLEEMSGK